MPSEFDSYKWITPKKKQNAILFAAALKLFWRKHEIMTPKHLNQKF